MLLFGYMLIAVLVQIAGRYFSFSIDWAAESATFAQIWMVLLSAGLAMRRNLHVSVDALAAIAPAWMLRGFTILTAAACLWFICETILGSINLIRAAIIQRSPVLGLPMWISYLSLPLGLTYFALELILSLVDKWLAPEAGEAADHP